MGAPTKPGSTKAPTKASTDLQTTFKLKALSSTTSPNVLNSSASFGVITAVVALIIGLFIIIACIFRNRIYNFKNNAMAKDKNTVFPTEGAIEIKEAEKEETSPKMKLFSNWSAKELQLWASNQEHGSILEEIFHGMSGQEVIDSSEADI